MFSFLNKENENQNLLDTHKNLTAIGVDAVNYINLLNLNSSPDIKKSINDYLKNREIENILFYNVYGSPRGENVENKLWNKATVANPPRDGFPTIFMLKAFFWGSQPNPILDPKQKKRVAEICKNVTFFMYRG